MSVRLRMKKLGRAHRPFYRICATNKRAPRDGRVLEELGTYDTSVPETDARAILKRDRIDYWLSVGAQPSEKVAVLIKKYGTNGTHLSAQQSALEKLAQPKIVPAAGAPASLPKQAEAEPTTEVADSASEDTQTDASAADESTASGEVDSSAETPEEAAAE